MTLLAAIREVQIPLLAVLLVGACLAKLGRVLRARSVDVALGPTALFPLRLQRPAAKAMCGTEMALGIALLVTAGRLGSGLTATAVRGLTAVLFVTASGALIELRQRRPDLGCGCFGDLSSTPVRLRTIVRSALLALAAAAAIGVPPVRLPPPGSALALRLALLAAGFAVIAALSPEISEALVRLGYSEPCELRVVPVERTLAALRASRLWRRHAPVLTADVPVDVWRELCWRYVVYPGRYGSREVEVVFAVHLRSRRPVVRAAVVDAVTAEVLPPLHVLPAPPADDGPMMPLPPHAVGPWPVVTRPPASTAPASTGPARTGPARTPPARTPPASTPPASTPPDAPPFPPAATTADATAAAAPGSLYSLLAPSRPVPRHAHNHADGPAGRSWPGPGIRAG